MENRSYLLHKVIAFLALFGVVARIISLLVGHSQSPYTPPPIAVAPPAPQSEQEKIDAQKRKAFFQSVGALRRQSGMDPSAPDGGQQP